MGASGLLGRLLGRGRAEAPHIRLGRRGERDAARFLRRAGLRVLARNLRTPGGEADMVCRDRRSGSIVLVEVKARVRASGERTIPATAAIDADKRRRLVATARSIASHPRFAGRPIRIDVMTVEYADEADRSPEVRHYVNAVTGDGKLR